MATMRGVLAGTLGLTLLQAIVSSKEATANASGMITLLSNGLARWFNPYTPLIPELRTPEELAVDPIPSWLRALAIGGGARNTPSSTPTTPKKAPKITNA